MTVVAHAHGVDAPPTADCRAAYRAALAELAAADPSVLCIDTDQGGLEDFAAAFPHQYYDMGIAEANAVTAAAGLASTGKTVFVNTMAAFASARALEQVKIDVAYNALPVKVVGTHCGLSAGHLGPTHHALEDVAIMRALPNMTVLVPADALETVALVHAAAALPGPVYLRLGRYATAVVHPDTPELEVGVALQLRAGSDVTLAATGCMPVVGALAAAERLAAAGIDARVLDVHTVKPLDVDAVVDAATTTAGIVSIEDHSTTGGLGGAISEVLAERGVGTLRRIGVPDVFCRHVGSHDELLAAFGIDVDGIFHAARELVGATKGPR